MAFPQRSPVIAPDPSPRHEGQETSAQERFEHRTGREASDKPYRKRGIRNPFKSRPAQRGASGR